MKDFYNNLNIGSLAISNDLLNSPQMLLNKFNEEGYLYLTQIVDASETRQLHESIISIFSQQQLLEKGTRPLHGITSCPPANEGEEAFFSIYDEIQKLECFHALPHSPAVLNTLKYLLGPTVFPHPLGVARLSFPSNIPCTTPPHQDYPNNQGTPDLYASWIPLTECPKEMGGLAILPNSHTEGLLPLEYSLGPGNRQVSLPEKLKQKQWLSAEFNAGDILIFHSHTLHCSLPNLTDRMRLSVDYRFQKEGEDITPRCLEPHFKRLAWDEIYKHWNSDRLKYYWNALTFNIVPWNDDYHHLPPEHLKEAVGINRAYQKNRERK
jgi:hypothetical protein